MIKKLSETKECVFLIIAVILVITGLISIIYSRSEMKKKVSEKPALILMKHSELIKAIPEKPETKPEKDISAQELGEQLAPGQVLDF